MQQRSIKKANAVIVRRGSAVLGRLSTHALQERIKAGRLLRTDRISSDGKNWVRIDQHPQLKKYFSKKRTPGRTSTRDPLMGRANSSGGDSKVKMLVAVLLVLVLVYILTSI